MALPLTANRSPPIVPQRANCLATGLEGFDERRLWRTRDNASYPCELQLDMIDRCVCACMHAVCCCCAPACFVRTFYSSELQLDTIDSCVHGACCLHCRSLLTSSSPTPPLPPGPAPPTNSH